MIIINQRLYRPIKGTHCVQYSPKYLVSFPIEVTRTRIIIVPVNGKWWVLARIARNTRSSLYHRNRCYFKILARFSKAKGSSSTAFALLPWLAYTDRRLSSLSPCHPSCLFILDTEGGWWMRGEISRPYHRVNGRLWWRCGTKPVETSTH